MTHARRNKDIELVQTIPIKRETYSLRKRYNVKVSGDAGDVRGSPLGAQIE
jgi:hypothetical protein